jgi:Family of unknown function (DUF6295)
MCSYQTSITPLTGSAKGAKGWFTVASAMAYFDHPYHSTEEHTLNIDLLNASEGPDARVAIELTPDSARALVACISEALEAAGAAGIAAPGFEARAPRT